MTEEQINGSIITLIVVAFVSVSSLIFPHFHRAGNSIPFLTRDASSVAVELSGDGIDSGIYFLPNGSTILDGIKTVKDVSSLESAITQTEARLLSGTSIVFLRGGSLPGFLISEMNAVKRLALDLPIDINKASEEEMDLIPGIGERTANEIINLRNARGKIRHLDELTAIKGIKEKRLSKLKHYFYIGKSGNVKAHP